MTSAAAAALLVLSPTAAPKPSLSFLKLRNHPSLLLPSPTPLRLPLRCTLQDVAVADADADTATAAADDVAAAAAATATAATATAADDVADADRKRKLYVANLPWSHTAKEIEELFAECGTVKKVEIIKQNNGLSRGFAFVVMGTAEEAQAAVDKFNSHELQGRTIRVEFAKSFRKPPPPATPRVFEVETRHKIYVSNLAWKVRSTNLREFFSSKFKPVSARVIFDDRKSAGYGFVSFATEEEAVAAFTELNGESLMERPLRLKMGQKKDESGSEPETDSTEVISDSS